MNLHRTEAVPQWETVPPEDRTIAQIAAAESNGIFTLANAATVAGFVLVTEGLIDIRAGHTGIGVLEIGAGRIADLVDGWLAEKFKTKSPSGERLDVGVDKLEAAIGFPILVSQGILPKSVASAFAAVEIGKGYGTALAKSRGNEIHPSGDGKQSAFGQWLSIGLFGLAKLSRNARLNSLSPGLEAAAYISAGVAVFLGAKAFMGYMKDALQPTPDEALIEPA